MNEQDRGPIREPSHKTKADGTDTVRWMRFKVRFAEYEQAWPKPPADIGTGPIYAANRPDGEIGFVSNAHGVCDACDCRTSPGDEIVWMPSTRVVRHLYCDPRGDYSARHQQLAKATADKMRALQIADALRTLRSLTAEERWHWFPHRYPDKQPRPEAHRLRLVR